MSPPVLDHVVLGGPDLAALVEWFVARTGVVPAPGGSHVGRGTRNELVDLGGGAYLELIGPDADQPDPGRPRPFGVDALTGPTVVTWAVRTDDIDAVITGARAAGYDPGDAEDMSRRTADGELLAWRLTPPGPPPGQRVALTPFVIDWGTTPHPATRGLPSTPLIRWAATHPDPAATRRRLAALRVALEVDPGPPGLTLVVRGVDGRPVTLD